MIVVLNRPMPDALSTALNVRSGKAEAKDMEELRDYGGGAQILSALGVHDMVLLTNTHHTPVALGGYGLAIVGERPIPLEEAEHGPIPDRRGALLRPSRTTCCSRARARRSRRRAIATRRSPCPARSKCRRAIALAAETGRYDGFVALGVVIRGETYHFEIVAGESARGIMALTLDGLAIGNGILTVENEAQALARARPDEKDKGGEAAKAALAMMALKGKFG